MFQPRSEEAPDGNDVEIEEILLAEHNVNSTRTEEVKPAENQINIDLDP